MSFLGMGTMEILIILLVAFIFLGPERMIDAAKTLGKWTGELRRMTSTVQAEMDDLANVNGPLASTYPDASNSDGAPAQPLDQDHPASAPVPAERTSRDDGAAKPVRTPSDQERHAPSDPAASATFRTSEGSDSTRPDTVQGQPARGEERA